MPRLTPLLLSLGLAASLSACTDYGIFGKSDKQPGNESEGGETDTGQPGTDSSDGGGTDSGWDPTDPETGDGGSGDGGSGDGGGDGASTGDGGSIDVPDFTDCEDVGLWVDQWWGSPPFDGETPPTDGSGRAYTGYDHDLLDFSTVSLPDEGHVPSGYDKVYRVYLWLDATGPRIFLDLQSDDGLWVHVNETSVGHWGGDWQEEGCVNDLANCTEYVEVGPVEITDQLHEGGNILAVRVSNAVNNSYMWVSPRCSDE